MKTTAVLLFASFAFATHAADVAHEVKNCGKAHLANVKKDLDKSKCDKKREFAAKVRGNVKTETQGELAKQIEDEVAQCYNAVERLNAKEPLDQKKLCACLQREITDGVTRAKGFRVNLNQAALKESAEIRCVLEK